MKETVFLRDPVMIMVCPTKALEDDIVSIIIANNRILTTNSTVRPHNHANPV